MVWTRMILPKYHPYYFTFQGGQLKKHFFSQYVSLSYAVLYSHPWITAKRWNWKKEFPLLKPLWMMTNPGLQHQWEARREAWGSLAMGQIYNITCIPNKTLGQRGGDLLRQSICHSQIRKPECSSLCWLLWLGHVSLTCGPCCIHQLPVETFILLYSLLFFYPMGTSWIRALWGVGVIGFP